MANSISGLLTQYTVRHRADRVIRMGGDEVQRLTKIDDEMTGQHRHVFKTAIHLYLQTGRTGIEDGDKAIVGVGAQPPVRGPGVVMNEIQKRITAAGGIPPRGAIPQRFGNARLTKYRADNGDADAVELATKTAICSG